MKKETKKRTVYQEYEIYIADDGTTFNNEKECTDYETSAKGVLRCKAEKLKGKEYNAWNLMGGYEDNGVIPFSVNTVEDVNLVLQLLFYECPWLSEERKLEIESIVTQAQKENDVVLIGVNGEGDYYFINSRNNIINNLKEL